MRRAGSGRSLPRSWARRSAFSSRNRATARTIGVPVNAAISSPVEPETRAPTPEAMLLVRRRVAGNALATLRRQSTTVQRERGLLAESLRLGHTADALRALKLMCTTLFASVELVELVELAIDEEHVDEWLEATRARERMLAAVVPCLVTAHGSVPGVDALLRSLVEPASLANLGGMVR